MAFPVIEASQTSFSDNVTSHSVSLPAGIVAGELLMIFFCCDGNPTITNPGGWTQLINAPAASNNARLYVGYRKATGSEGGSVTVTTSAAEDSNHISIRVSGAADPTVTAPQASTGATGSDANPNPDSLTASGGTQDYRWLAIEGHDRSRTTDAIPSGYSSVQAVASGGAQGSGVAVATRTSTSATEDPGTFTISTGDEWRAHTIAIHPAPPVFVYPPWPRPLRQHLARLTR